MKKILALLFTVLFPLICHAGVNVIPNQSVISINGSYTSGNCVKFANSGSGAQASLQDAGAPCGSGGGGGVSSLTGDSVIFNNSASTGAVTLALIAQTKNTFLAGPTSGVNTNPTFRALVGADLPNPSASTLGGIESYASVSHQWINTISTAGVPSSTQPACGDLSNAAASCSTDATNANNISSGTLAAARGGTGVSNTATLTLGTSNQNWATLGTGIVKNTTTTGALSNAASSDIIGLFTGCSGTQYLGADGACHTAGGSGTVTSFSSGNFSPLFNTSVATATTTPALSFSAINQNANQIFAGPASGAAAAPTFRSQVFADLPAFDQQADVAYARTMQMGSMKSPDQAFYTGQMVRTNKANTFSAIQTFSKNTNFNGDIIFFGQDMSGITGVGSNFVSDNNANVNNFQINSGTAQFNAMGMSILDDNASGKSLTFDVNSSLSAFHTLTFNVNNADRTLTIDANLDVKYVNAMASNVAMLNFGGL